jgi:putative ABC transport system permease protein
MWSLLRTVSARRLIEHPIRTLLTIVGIALGVASFVSVQMILHTMTDSFSSMIDSISGKAKLQITGGETGVDDSIYDILQKKDANGRLPVPGLRAALPTMQIVTKYQGERLMILAVDLLNDKEARDYKMTGPGGVEITDPLEFLNSKDSLMLNVEFAKKRNIALDSRIELLTAKGRKSFVVRGYLDAVGAATTYGGAFALMDIYSAQIVFEKPGRFDTIDLVLEPNAGPEQVKTGVEALLGGKFDVQRPAQRNEGVDSMLYDIRQGLTIMAMVVLLMGGFIVYNTVTTLVYQRMREIGILRMVGVTRSSIARLFVFEAGLLGLIGTTIGVFGGYWIGRVTILNYMSSVSNIFVPVNVNYAAFDWKMVLRGATIGLGVSLAGGLWPAIRATRITPLEVLHFKPSLSNLGTRYRIVSPIFRWVAVGALCGGYVLLALNWTALNHVAALQLAMLSLIVFGIALTPLFMRVFFRFLTRATARMKNPLARLAAENILRDLGRSAMTVAAFMVALAVMFEIYLFMNSMQTEIKTWMDEVLTADLLVTSSSSFATRSSVPMSDDLTAQFKGVPGVADVVQLRSMFNDYDHARILLVGVNYAHRVNRSRFHFPEKYDEAAVQAFSRDEGVFISENLVARHPQLRGAKTIELSTPEGRAPLPILGVIVDYTFETGTLLINRGLFMKTFKDALVDTFQIYAQPGANIENLRHAIENLLGAEFNLYVLTNREFKHSILGAIDQLFALAVSLEILTLIISLIGIVNNLMANVIDHTREIGVLRSLGATRLQVATIYFMQSGLLGLSGALVGMFIGYGLGWIHMTRLSKMLTGWSMGMHFSLGLIAIVFFGSIAVSVVAGLFPARKAAGLPLREALKYE